MPETQSSTEKAAYDANANQLSRNAICSSWRSLRSAAKPAFGGEAVVKSADAVHQKHLVHRFYDGFAAERRLRQLLQEACCA